MTNAEFLRIGLEKTGIKSTLAQQDTLLQYMELTLEKNKVMNLTALRTPEEFIEKNIIDCAALAELIPMGAKVLDLGSGAGLPGIVCAILCKDSQFTLADALEKRVAFLEETIDALGLDNVEAIHLRAEEAAKKAPHREAYDFVTARAVANLGMLAELCCGFLTVGGTFAPMKASDEAEIEKAQSALKILHLELKDEKHFTLPFEGSQRKILLLKKTESTPLRYPRNPKQMKNKPL